MKSIIKMQRISAIEKRGIAVRNFKWAIMIALYVLCTGTAFGQMKIKVGATAGFNFATLIVDEEVWDLKAGFRGGAIADLGLNKYFSIVPELIFSQKGWKKFGEGEEKGITQIGTVNYVEMPVNFAVKFKLGGDVKLTLLPGLYAGYAISGKTKLSEKGVGMQTEKIPIGKGFDDYNPLDIGLDLGLGLEINSIIIRAQYHAGLKNVSNDPGYTSTTGTVSMSVGYLF